MGLLVDIPKPRAWPPPPPEDTQRVTELLEYGAKRDPIGDKVHTAFACLFMFCLPLATESSGTATIILFVHSLLRLPTTWRTLTPLLKSSVYWSILAWVLYSTLSIAWSSDIPMGLGSCRINVVAGGNSRIIVASFTQVENGLSQQALLECFYKTCAKLAN